MKRLVMIGLAILFGSYMLAALPQTAPVKATGSVELKDAAGDMGPISTSSGEEPPLDVVLLAIRSDGSRITFAATIKDPLGSFATAPVTINIDVDNNPATGTKPFVSSGMGGFEYKAELMMCIKYSDKSEACSGGSTKGKPTSRYAAVELKRFKGDSEMSADTVLDSMGFPGSKAAVQVPITGQIVEASIEYADLKVKSGQTIRLLAKETGGRPKDDGAFPIILLTLK
jgi:hypothetical protein